MQSPKSCRGRSRTSMSVPLVSFPAILSTFLSLFELVGAVVPQIEARSPGENHHQQRHQLIRELQEAKLEIVRLESILEESIQNLNAKSHYLSEGEKLVEEMTLEIDRLKSALYNFKDDKSHVEERLRRVNELEEEVLLLWDTSRKNNFDIHILESKAHDAEKRLELINSQVQQMVDIITEQWIQIQQLEQAVQITKMRTMNVKMQTNSTRCTLLKFSENLFGSHLQTLIQHLNQYLFEERFAWNSYGSQFLHQLRRTYLAAKHYHHQLQGYIKQEMERNYFTAPLANSEVVFFVASALLTFPIMGAWMLLSAQFS